MEWAFVGIHCAKSVFWITCPLFAETNCGTVEGTEKGHGEGNTKSAAQELAAYDALQKFYLGL